MSALGFTLIVKALLELSGFFLLGRGLLYLLAGQKREQNIFYRRNENGLTQHGMKEMNTRDTIPLGAAIIHAVTNPLDQITGALHVYGGDFFATPRSEWDPATFEEHPYDMEHTLRAFAEANERLGDKK